MSKLGSARFLNQSARVQILQVMECVVLRDYHTGTDWDFEDPTAPHQTAYEVLVKSGTYMGHRFLIDAVDVVLDE